MWNLWGQTLESGELDRLEIRILRNAQGAIKATFNRPVYHGGGSHEVTCRTIGG